MFHIQYDGTVFDHKDRTVLGGDADAILTRLTESFADGLDAGAAVRAGAAALGRAGPHAAGRRPRGRAAAHEATGAAASGV